MRASGKPPVRAENSCVATLNGDDVVDLSDFLSYVNAFNTAVGAAIAIGLMRIAG